MQNFQLLKNILGSHFFISEEGVETYTPMVQQLLAGGSPKRPEGVSGLFSHMATMGVAYLAEPHAYMESPVLVDGILIIPVTGPLMQYDMCWSAGTTTIASWYRQGEADPNVKGFLELMNSPGGQVFGIAELSLTKQRLNKPVVTYCEGVCASGGMWIASASSGGIYASSENCVFGSIGVMRSIRNNENAMKASGIITVDVYSKTSPGKNRETRDAKDGNFKTMEGGLLYQMDQNFMQHISVSRPAATDKALEGDVFTTSLAKENGLCDGILSFNEALIKAGQPSGSTPIPTKKPVSTPMKTSALLVSMLSFFGNVSMTDDDGTLRTDESLATELFPMITKLSAAGAMATSMLAGVTKERDEAVASLEAQTDALAVESAAHELTLKSLKAPAGAPTATSLNGGEELNRPAVVGSVTKVAALPHIQAALESMGLNA